MCAAKEPLVFQSVQLSAAEYASLVHHRVAAEKDLYFVDSINHTAAGHKLIPAIEHCCNRLQLQALDKMEVTSWWGAPGHTEPVHVDLYDGTLWQLVGQKRITLLPPALWQQMPHFPGDGSGAVPWTFSQSTLAQPDTTTWPHMEQLVTQCIEVLLNPGEVLYIPAMWAHEVTGIAQGSCEHVLSVNKFWRTPEERVQCYVPAGCSREGFLKD